MGEIQQGFNYTAITAAGSTVVIARPCILHRVVFPGTYVGTLTLYDTATAAGTAAGNRVAIFPLPAVSTFQSVEMNVSMRKGIVYDAGGTPTSTIVWG